MCQVNHSSLHCNTIIIFRIITRPKKNDEGKENALYYLSQTLTGAKLNYTPIVKLWKALFFSIKKLGHYIHAYSVDLILEANPMKLWVLIETKCRNSQEAIER